MIQGKTPQTKSEGAKQRSVKAPAPAVAAPVSSVDGVATALLESMSADSSQATFQRHAALLGDGRLSHPANTVQRARLVQHLQRDYGNAYVQRLVRYVSRSTDDGQGNSFLGSGLVQAAEGEESRGEAYPVGVDIAAHLEQERAYGRSLEPGVRRDMEGAFGRDLGDVRVHTDAEADALNREVHAEAFTTGNDIFFRSGNYAPETERGKGLLAHELTHVVGQQQVAVSRLHRQEAAGAPAAAPVAAGPTTDVLLNEWLAVHAGAHLSSDLTWILAQWPEGGAMTDLDAGFRADVQALLNFARTAPGAQFNIISYARSPQKQHVMHVGHWIRRGLVGYNAYRFSGWGGVTAAGGRAAILAQNPEQRRATLQGIANPEVLNIVWDTDTAASSRTAGIAISQAYGIGANNPCANSGAAYSWPTGDTTTSPHGTGRAVDADPVAFPNVTTITQAQARVWPDLAAVQGQFGAANVQQAAATATTPASYTITGLANVAQRDAFLEMFFGVVSAARARPPFVDLQHFQAP